MELNHVGWHQFLYQPILLSTEQLARSGEKYWWSLLQLDEREAAFEDVRAVDGATEEVVSVAVVAIAITCRTASCWRCAPAGRVWPHR